ncbi:MAG: hypothetical protein AAF890_03440 [Pseudomonadota bacterium]
MRYDTEYSVGANTSAAERNMRGLVTQARATGAGIVSGLAPANAGISKLTVGLGAAGAAATALTVLPGVLRDVVAEASEIGKVADRIGIGTEALQELRFSAEKFGVSAGEVDKGLQEFNKRIGEAMTGTGNLKKILDANGISLRDQNGNLKDSVTLMAEYADLIANAESQQQKAYLAQEAFSRSGQKMINVLQNGSGAFKDQIKNAKDLGVAIEDDLIRKAEIWDDQWADFTKSLSTNFKSTALDIVGDVSGIGNSFTSLLESPSLRNFLKLVDKAADANPLALPGSKSNLADTLTSQTASEKVGNRISDAFGEAEQKITAADKALQTMLRQKGLSERGIATVLPSTDKDAANKKALADAKSAAAEMQRERDASSQAAERERDRINGVIEALHFEADAIGKSALQRKADTALRRAGVDASSAEGQAILGLVEKIEQKNLVLRQAQEEQARLNQQQLNMAQANDFLASSTFQMFEGMVTGAASAEDAMKSLVVQIARAVAEAALLGKGPLAGMLGTSGGGLLTNMFGGGGSLYTGSMSSGLSTTSAVTSAIGAGVGGLFQSGGYTGDGSPSAVAGLVHGQEYVINAQATKRHRSMLEQINAGTFAMPAVPSMSVMSGPAQQASGPQAVHVTVGVSADGNGNLMPFVESVAQASAANAVGQYDQSSEQRTRTQIERLRRNAVIT